jgi:hypothetical protein
MRGHCGYRRLRKSAVSGRTLRWYGRQAHSGVMRSPIEDSFTIARTVEIAFGYVTTRTIGWSGPPPW